MIRFGLPVLFILAIIIFLIALQKDPREIPSPFVGKPAPPFSLVSLYDNNVLVDNSDLIDHVSLVNVFASWCTACYQEHPLLFDLNNSNNIQLVGLNYKDASNDAKAWLEKLGNPYDIIAYDFEGRTGIDWGVYGVPETFVIDKKGIVRHKHIGPITQQDIETTLIPLINQLLQETS